MHYTNYFGFMKKNIALVLSSGGARGCAHIGVIKVLEENGFKITSVAGTSMGALVGGIYATGQLRQFEDWIAELDKMEVLKLTDFTISRKGLVKGKKVIDRIKEIIPERNIEDLPIPYCAVATDIINKKEVAFTHGKLYDAIRASISIPTVFQPMKIGNRYFVDGGILNPIPVNHVERNGNDCLVVVDVNAPVPTLAKTSEEEHIPGNQHHELIKKIQDKIHHFSTSKKDQEIGIFNLTNQSIGMMMHRITELTLEKYKPDLLISISRESFNFYDFYKAREIIQEGEVVTRNALQDHSLE